MPKEKMTPKERWLCVLKGEIPDRVPMDYWGTKEVTEKLMKYFGCNDEISLYKKLHIDKAFQVSPKYIGPPLKEGEDFYGCRYKKVNYGTGIYKECIYYPLAKYNSIEEIEKNYTWPSPDWFDYSVVKEQIRGKEEYPICGGGSEPFLIYKNLRGQEQAYIDLIENPELVHYCLDKLYNFCYEFTLRIYEQIPFKITYSYVAEDMGSQEDLLFSIKHIREFFIPRMKKMIELIHQQGAYVFFHSDGAIRKIIPDMIEIGIDILNPIQWRCKGMDRKELKKEFGKKVTFHGAVDNQKTLPFGSKEDVKKEVIENIEILGKGGGYILAPCHNIQPITPIENIITMYEVGYECGWY